MTTPKLNDDSSLSINIKWLIQIVILVGTAVYLYFGLENRIAANEDELQSLRYNQNTYIFPDIRVLENEVIDFKLERERVRKDIQRLREIINE
jgi:flagellar basal body-associated protein FliL